MALAVSAAGFHLRERHAYRGVSARWAEALHAQPERLHVAILGKLDGLARKSLGLAFKKFLDSERRLVATALGPAIFTYIVTGREFPVSRYFAVFRRSHKSRRFHNHRRPAQARDGMGMTNASEA